MDTRGSFKTKSQISITKLSVHPIVFAVRTSTTVNNGFEIGSGRSILSRSLALPMPTSAPMAIRFDPVNRLQRTISIQIITVVNSFGKLFIRVTMIDSGDSRRFDIPGVERVPI